MVFCRSEAEIGDPRLKMTGTLPSLAIDTPSFNLDFFMLIGLIPYLDGSAVGISEWEERTLPRLTICTCIKRIKK